MQDKENRDEEQNRAEATFSHKDRSRITREETVYPTRGGSHYSVREETAYPTYGKSRYPVREETTYPTRGKSRYPVREETIYPSHEGSHYPVREETTYPSRKESRYLTEETTMTTRRQAETRTEEHFAKESRKTEFHLGNREKEEKSGRTASDFHHHARNNAPIRHTHHKRKKKRKNPLGLFLVIIILAVFIGFGCFRFVEGLLSPTTGTENLTGEMVEVTIPKGADTATIAEILKEKKLVKSKFSFRLSSKLNGYDGTYQQGTYDVDTGMTPTQIMELLQTGVVHYEKKITIPEGYNVRQIAEKAEEVGICTAEEFIEETNHGFFAYDFVENLPQREYMLEGYLFPDTYYLSNDMTAHDLVDMMLARFDKMYTAEYKKAVEESGHSLDEIVTIASMIEKEINVDEERERAAGVIYNRLKEEMSLGIDATVLYAIGKSAGELTKADLQIDSPYNTRINKGLPLGPIANAGEASFRAALYPEKNDYLYYVVEKKGSNSHVFTKTYEEFLAAKKKYQNSVE